MVQSIAGTDLATTATASPRQVAAKVEIKWDGTTWTDETSRVRSLSGSMWLGNVEVGFVMPGGAPTNTLKVTLRNEDNRYSVLNTSGPIYQYIQDAKLHMKQIRVSMGFYSGSTPERLVQFTGYIDWPREGTAEKRVTFDCADITAQIKRIPKSTAMYTSQNLGSWIGIMAGLVGIGTGDRIIDTGMFTVPYAWLEKEDVGTQMKKAAQADGGRLYVSKEGKLIFENMHHWLDETEHTTSQHTFTASRIKDLGPRIVSENVFDRVVVEVDPREEEVLSVVYSRPDAVEVPPGSSVKISALLDYPCTSIVTPAESEDFITITSGNRLVTGDVTFETTKYAQRAELVAKNSNLNYALYLIRLRLRGYPLHGGPHDEVEVASAAGYAQDERMHRITNLYVQTKSHAEALGEFYRDLLERPKLIYEITGALAIPWLEPGDRVKAQVAIADVDRDAFIVGFDWSWRPKGQYRFERLGLVDCKHVLPLSDYFRAGTDVVCSQAGQIACDANAILKNKGEADEKFAVQFTPTSQFTLRAAEIPMIRTGSPGGRIRLVICADSGGLPGSPITGGTSRWNSVDGEVETVQRGWIPFIFPDEPTLVASTVYHLVFEADDDYTYVISPEAAVKWSYETVGSGGTAERYNGVTQTWSEWTTAKFAFRVYQNPLFY